MEEFTQAEWAEIEAHLANLERVQNTMLGKLHQLQRVLQRRAADEEGQRQFKRRDPRVTKSLSSKASWGLLDGCLRAQREGSLETWLDFGKMVQRAGGDLYLRWCERQCEPAAA